MGEEGEDLPGRGVEPLGVVDHDQEPPVAGELLEPGEHVQAEPERGGTRGGPLSADVGEQPVAQLPPGLRPRRRAR